MPEGDTLHKLAARIRPGLLDRPVVEVRERDRGVIRPVVGKTITEVTAVGKNLLIAIERQFIVRVHLGLKGRARMWVPSEDWRSRSRAANITVASDALAFAAFRTMHARTHRKDDPLLERALAQLGPDLLDPNVDMDRVLARARGPAYADTPISVLLLDQRVCAGIGNVYRSEVLFLEGVHPRARVGDLDDVRLSAIFERARTLMLSNLGEGPRVSVGPRRGARRQPGTPNLFVYRRRGMPCIRCPARIERDVIGTQARSIYWCPRCQPASGPALVR
ncbi:MAG: DNA-formamidopyrimidine glycosylase family protein [Myxococcota bacterium]